MLRHPRFSGLYQLDIPNKEVRIGLMRSLLPNYVQRPAELNTLVAEKIYNGDMDGALVLMRTVLSTIPYCENTHYEGHYQQLLYVIFYVDRQLCGRRGPYPQRPCGYGDAHPDHPLCRGIKVE